MIPNDLCKNFTVLKKCTNKFDCLVYEMLYVNARKPSLNVQSDSIFVMFSNSFSQLFVFSHCFLTPIFATFYILLLSCQSCQVINSVFGLLCRKTVPREREDTRVWYRETMFSQTVHGIFPCTNTFCTSSPLPRQKKPEGIANLKKAICVVQSDLIIGVTLHFFLFEFKSVDDVGTGKPREMLTLHTNPHAVGSH